MCKGREMDRNFLNRWLFIDEVTIHSRSRVNTHSVTVWEIENPHVSYKFEKATYS
jgi:hypothetical protein